MLTTLLFFGLFLVVVWALRRLWRGLCGGASLLFTAMAGSLRRSVIVGSMPRRDDLALHARIARSGSSLEDFHRLTRGAMVYANWPGVTVIHHVAYWPEDPVLVRTTADPYGKRAYVETLRLVADKVIHVVCLYLDRAEIPVEVGSAEFPDEQARVWVLSRIEDIVREGAFLSLRDPAGRVRETRLPKKVKHHA